MIWLKIKINIILNDVFTVVFLFKCTNCVFYQMFNEAETFREMINIEPNLPAVSEEAVPEKPSSGKRKKNLKNLPVFTEVFELPAAEQICPKCGNPLHVMSERERLEIEVIPAKVRVHKYITHIYSCRSCERAGIATIVNAPGMRPPVLEKSVVNEGIRGWTSGT